MPPLSSSSSQEIASQIKSLLHDIPVDERADAARWDELRRILAALIQQGDLTFASSPSSPSSNNNNINNTKQSVQAKWNVWLQHQHKQCVVQLVQRMRQGRRTAVRTLWGFLAASPLVTARGCHHYLNSELLFQWLAALVAMPLDVVNDKSMHHLLQVEVMSHRDVQYYALRVIARWANEQYYRQAEKKDQESLGNEADDKITQQEQVDRMVQILIMIPFPTSQQVLDSPTSKFLFPPPPAPKNTNNASGKYQDGEEQDDSNDDDEKDSDDDDESEDDSSNSNSEDESDRNQSPSRQKKQSSSTKQQRQSSLFAYQSAKCHLNALTKAWLAILRLSLSTASLKKALLFLSSQVLPQISNPLRFADLFMRAYSGGTTAESDADNNNKDNNNTHDGSSNSSSSMIPLLALDGLFYLMTQHRLEYPQFYTQLYSLLKPKLFYVKYRTRFFALLQKCLLRNEMLPAHIVAAFLKRLLRCAIQAPPAGALFVLALVSNLLRQHEECAALIHRTCDTLDDKYDPDTDDPVQSQALQSSLWELQALEHHYLPAVATLAQSIGREDAKSPMFQLEEMAQHSYASLIEQERKRRHKSSNSSSSHHKKRKHEHDNSKEPATPVTFVQPTALFTSTDVFAGILKVPSST